MISCIFQKFQKTKAFSLKIYQITLDNRSFTLEVVVYPSRKYKYLLFDDVLKDQFRLCHVTSTWNEMKCYIINKRLHEK